MSIPIEMITEDDSLALHEAGFYWRERDGVRALICAPLEEDGFTNAFSTRIGGVSPMPGNSLNLAGFNEDDAENIYENRRRFLNLLDGDWILTGCWQTHSADVRLVQNKDDARPKPDVLGESEFCDALVTSTSGILLAVKTADCVPVVLGDSTTGAFAAVHAGWRGTSSSILVRAIERLETEYQAKPQDLRAAIGPAANVCCYEVGADVIGTFKERFAGSDSLFVETRQDHARIDLQKANREQLINMGVLPDRIHVAPLCTMDRTDLFFSYRREKAVHGRVGRLMAVIGRKPE